MRLEAFYIGAHEVTNAEYLEFCRATGRRLPEFWGEEIRRSGPEFPNHPVMGVSWADAVEFCECLSDKESKTYRLPTEAEWEYACRAGTTTRYSFGDDTSLLGKYAWVNTKDVSEKSAHEVRQKKPNGLGLYDMHGNVAEWCSDWYGKYESLSSDPTGPSSGSARVFRGGSWYNVAGGCRSASRSSASPGVRDVTLGFRVVLLPADAFGR